MEMSKTPRDLIKEQIEQYYKWSVTMSIDTLMRMQDVISWNYYFISEQYFQLMKKYISSYWVYRWEFAKLFLETLAKKITEDMTGKKAEEIAKDGTILQLVEQMTAQAEIKAFEQELKGIDKVLFSISQRVSELKSQKNITKLIMKDTEKHGIKNTQHIKEIEWEK